MSDQDSPTPDAAGTMESNDHDEEGVSDMETPEADAAEQHAEIEPEMETPDLDQVPPEVDPADAEEQNRVVELDEDDYR